MEKLSFRLVVADNQLDILTIQTVYEASTQYFQIVQGGAPVKDAARNDLMRTPFGCSIEHKFFYAIEYEEVTIGCMDLIQGYPHHKTVFIGLLLFIESHQNLGFGVKTLEFIHRFAQQRKCDRLRIAVVDLNRRAYSFWLREGFIEIYRKKMDDNQNFVIVMEKIL